MIRGMHGMFFSSKPEELRAFLRDKLDLPATDVGGGWLIFEVPHAEVGVHPEGEEASTRSGVHDVSFTTDDLAATVEELKGRGVEFLDEIQDQGYGLTIHLEAPGGVRIEVYQPRYKLSS